MAAAAILKIGLMAISRSLWHIFAWNFAQGLKTILHKPFCCQKSIPTKSKMVAAAILKVFLTGTTRLLLNIFAQNFAQSVETTSRKVLPSDFTSEKIQYGGSCHFEIHFNCHPSPYCIYSHKIWHRV